MKNLIQRLTIFSIKTEWTWKPNELYFTSSSLVQEVKFYLDHARRLWFKLHQHIDHATKFHSKWGHRERENGIWNNIFLIPFQIKWYGSKRESLTIALIEAITFQSWNISIGWQLQHMRKEATKSNSGFTNGLK